MTIRGNLSELDWVAVDWGTTSLRVWAMNREGKVLAQKRSDTGMRKLASADYEPNLLDLIDEWLGEAHPDPVRVVVCGMAGARSGWHEIAYRPTPCEPVSGSTWIAVSDSRIRVAIVAGLSQSEPLDVMRGEETQLAGLVASGVADAIACLPGTHSKWVKVKNGTVTGFQTFMTGEMFALLRDNSVLRHSVDQGEVEAGSTFRAAVEQGAAAPQALSGALFSIRAADMLNGRNAEWALASLSGLLIGVELAACKKMWDGHTVHLVGDGELSAAYATALRVLGTEPVISSSRECTIAGLKQARALMREDKA